MLAHGSLDAALHLERVAFILRALWLATQSALSQVSAAIARLRAAIPDPQRASACTHLLAFAARSARRHAACQSEHQDRAASTLGLQGAHCYKSLTCSPSKINWGCRSGLKPTGRWQPMTCCPPSWRRLRWRSPAAVLQLLLQVQHAQRCTACAALAQLHTQCAGEGAGLQGAGSL